MPFADEFIFHHRDVGGGTAKRDGAKLQENEG
jgi:hypothetical protein